MATVMPKGDGGSKGWMVGATNSSFHFVFTSENSGSGMVGAPGGWVEGQGGSGVVGAPGGWVEGQGALW